MEQKKIEVSVEGNPRGKLISKEEVQQVIKDLISWFKDNSQKLTQQLKPAANDDDIKKLLEGISFQSLNSELEQLLRGANGGFQLHDAYVTLSTKDIVEINEVNAVSGYWKNNYLTFAQDSDENFLIIENDTGKIISWNKDEGIQEPINENMGLYLEKLRNGVLKKELEYIEEVGLVEHQG